MGVIYMSKKQYKDAEVYLKKVEERERNYKGNTFLLLSICFMKMGKIEKAEEYVEMQSRENQTI